MELNQLNTSYVIIRGHGGSYSMWSSNFVRNYYRRMCFVLQKASGKHREMYKSYILGVHRHHIILTFKTETLTCFHATS